MQFLKSISSSSDSVSVPRLICSKLLQSLKLQVEVIPFPVCFLEKIFAPYSNPPFKNLVINSRDIESPSSFFCKGILKYSLYGIIEEQDELAKAVDAGFFPECSIGAKRSGETGKLYLHHLAYLGEEPAAIKSFKKNIKEKIQLDDSGVIHAFPAVWKITLSDMDEGVKKMNELDEAKKRIAELEAELQRLTAELEAAKAGSNGSGEDFEKLKTENEELKRKLLAFQEKHPEDELSLSDSDPRTKMLLNELRKTKTASLMQAAKGKVPAAHLKDLEVLANGLTLSNELLLSDGKKASSIETLTAIFNAMADPVLGTEIVLSDPEAKSAGQGASYASSAVKLMGAL
ncbi:hypothetical protein [Treponema phagedenis]|uniref:Uncharacterized protein n=1 Tax=Treponema phagedenis TaxID=162 RepID=A0AAE6IW90_TREPH|nr:hypothetical protein [Treponema phagedenis]QEJ99146.1 hypothetical protein FUT82_14860 [Treponema phagedenis]